MERFSTENFIKEQLNKYFPKLFLDETLLEKNEGVEIYTDFLITNLRDIFEQVCSTFDNSMLQSIPHIVFPFRNIEIAFTIEVFNKAYVGRYTAFCPELIGCITEGDTKMEALENLCYAIAEVLILNYDFLKINPLTKNSDSPTVTAKFFHYSEDIYSYNFSKTFYMEAGFKHFYLSKKHLLLKKDDSPQVTLTLPNRAIQQLTKHLLKKVVGLE